MPDRLQELLRQRALVQEHLSWLDREIAAASGAHASSSGAHASSAGPVAPAAPRPTPPPPAPFRPAPAHPVLSAPAAPAPSGYLASQAAAIARQTATSRAEAAAAASASSGESPVVNATADAILQEYRTEPSSLKTDIRKGCFLYFFAALALLAAGVTALYFLISKH